MNIPDAIRRYLWRVFVLSVWMVMLVLFSGLVAGVLAILENFFSETTSLIIFLALIPVVLPLIMAMLPRLRILNRLNDKLL